MKSALIALCFFLSVSCSARVFRQMILNSPGYIGGAGLFHNFHIVVGLLDYYEKNPGSSLIVDFVNKGLYYEPKYGSNWWRYYFEPIVLSPTTKTRHRLVAKFIEDDEKAYFGNTAHFYFSRAKANELISKYIKLKKNLEKEIEKFYEKNLKGSYLIGVHYRSSDKDFEAPHVSFEKVVARVKKHIHSVKSKNYKVFLATDDKAALEYFKNQFQDKLFFQNVFFSEGQVGAHYIYRGYESGKRAVIDCYLLSKCQVLIRTSSNLSAASAFINPKIKVINLNRIFLGETFAFINEKKLNELNRVTK